jgi:hypothetical protein
MSLTNPDKPDNFSFLQCAKDFYNSKERYKLPQATNTQFVEGCTGFLYHYLADNEDFMYSWQESKNNERIKTITYFLILNAAIEGEI